MGQAASWTDTIDPNDPLNSRGYILVGFNNLSSNSGTLAPPEPLAPAQLLIENGATLTDQEGGNIGYSPDSSGEVTVESGGLWDLSSSASHGAGFADVGQSGSGTLSVLAGGSVALGSLGTFMSNGTTFFGGGMGVGQNGGSSGTVIVDGDGRADFDTERHCGREGGPGAAGYSQRRRRAGECRGLSIGTVNNASSSGTVIVGGTGAAAFLNFGSVAGGLTVGSASRGTLIVADDGRST